ncbi:family 43 glycosylhydrolase [Paenibacillus sp. p3-SID867]|uniref:family 43 glycosylhydrolase n=1 Tax=Paenibacillus sp. p3-SID867 TaxID=2916363 RepID=UPI0021A63505|nr:family 43 glycosylhydrolase [Paenibacillus sp. p3-SID867]MCT1402105.1 family 43 glycosylhydrolase [Paenibacillus sp. p3-SID867]
MPISMPRLSKIVCCLGMLGLAAGLALSGCDSRTKPEAVDLDIYNEKMYANPFPSLEEEWEDYGNGDPYILRHDGRYYLYVSTKDHRTGIKAWISDNLVDWRYAGLVTEDPVSTGAYAPEVIYWNGWFYLYTSPAGKGHYVFRSESPTGPFERISDNVGMSIDGSVFIDDDGSWLFTHAGSSGIVGVPMDGPAEFGVGQTIQGPYLGHWTEGSMIIKRNGTYYMTYTGNHVFSKGYRIHYAVSHDSALGPYTIPANNPLVISTKPDFYGLGHSSTVMGPDLDSYYLVYHNLTGRSQEGPPVRRMNIDRLVFNGDKMEILGPTNYDQPVPGGPVFADRLDAEAIDQSRWEAADSGGSAQIISKVSTDGVFTVEYNLVPSKAPVAALFAYQDANQYGFAEIDPEQNGLSLGRMQDGSRKVLATVELPADTDWSKLHTIRVERGEDRLRVYLDGVLKLDQSAVPFEPGKIGYRYQNGEPSFSYTAFSNHASGSSDFETAKPLPGSMEAVHYLSGEGRGFSVRHPSEAGAWRGSDGTAIKMAEDGSYSASLTDKGDWLRYAVNVSESGTYALDLTVKAGMGPTSFKLLVDDKKVENYKVDGSHYSGSGSEPWVKIRVGSLKLEKGLHSLAIQLDSDHTMEWKTMDFELVDMQTFKLENLLEQTSSEDVHGQWIETDGGYAGAANSDAKMYGGSPLWTDYRIRTTVKLGDDPSGQAGVLFRVTNESDFRDQVSDSLMGYFLAVGATKLELYKHNYDSELLHSVKVSLKANEPTSLRIEAVRGTIRVYVQDGREPILTYDDPRAFMQGRVGLRSVHAEQIELGDLTVESMGTK